MLLLLLSLDVRFAVSLCSESIYICLWVAYECSHSLALGHIFAAFSIFILSLSLYCLSVICGGLTLSELMIWWKGWPPCWRCVMSDSKKKNKNEDKSMGMAIDIDLTYSLQTMNVGVMVPAFASARVLQYGWSMRHIKSMGFWVFIHFHCFHPTIMFVCPSAYARTHTQFIAAVTNWNSLTSLERTIGVVENIW